MRHTAETCGAPGGTSSSDRDCHGHPHLDLGPVSQLLRSDLPTQVVAKIDTGDTAWLLAASALVLLMAPGLALFYGGMVRSKSVLNMMMMTFGALAAIIVIWVLVGYSLAFGDDLGGGLLGDPLQYFGLQPLVAESADSWLTVPIILFAIFQGLFCVITGPWSPAPSPTGPGSVPGWCSSRCGPCWSTRRSRTGSSTSTATGTSGGWLANRVGTIDFAGGMAVEICSGAIGAGARPGRRHPGRVRQGRDAAAQPDPGDARRGAALVRLVRLQRRLRPRRQPRGGGRVRDHHLRRAAGAIGWLAPGAVPRRPRHHPRRGLGHGRRPGGDHAERRLGHPAGRAR